MLEFDVPRSEKNASKLDHLAQEQLTQLLLGQKRLAEGIHRIEGHIRELGAVGRRDGKDNKETSVVLAKSNNSAGFFPAVGEGHSDDNSLFERPKMLHLRSQNSITSLPSVDSQGLMAEAALHRWSAERRPVKAATRRALTEGWPGSVGMRDGLLGELDVDNIALTGALGLSQGQQFQVSSIGISKNYSIGGMKYDPGTLKTYSMKSIALNLMDFESTLDPDDRIVVTIDVLSFVVLLYDVVMIPIMLAWELEPSGGLQAVAVVIASFWLFDLMMQLKVGFYTKEGDLVLDPERVRWNFLRGWFCIDLLLICTDWALVTSTFLVGSAQRVLTFPKIVRFMKLLRLSRLGRFMERLSVRSLTARSHVSMLLLQIIGGILIVNHVLACVWFTVGDRWGEHLRPRSWLDIADKDLNSPNAFEESSIAFQYTTALHWMTAQVTLASVYVVPNNVLEGMLSIFLLIYGLLFGGTIVSILSAQTVKYVMVRQESTRNVAVLLRFLKEQKVSRRLSTAIRRHVASRLRKEQPLSEYDIPMLEMMGTNLRQRLHVELRTPHLVSHTLFRVWSHLEVIAMEALCEIVFVSHYSRGDTVFETRGAAEAAMIVLKGRLLYKQAPIPKVVLEHSVQDVDPGQWVCEAALWCCWVHGRARGL